LSRASDEADNSALTILAWIAVKIVECAPVGNAGANSVGSTDAVTAGSAGPAMAGSAARTLAASNPDRPAKLRRVLRSARRSPSGARFEVDGDSKALGEEESPMQKPGVVDAVG